MAFNNYKDNKSTGIIQAPYRFVPLSNLVVIPEWAEQVSHDKPFKDGICGELELLITTQGDVCVGGEQIPATKSEPGKVNFFTTPDNKIAIPASSLKGMLRNTLEIATYSKMKQVEEQKLGVRDIREANNFYHKAIKDPETGWLRFEEGVWKIYPCEFARIHQKDIISSLGISYSTWTSVSSIMGRYNVMNEVCPAINFDFAKKKNRNGQLVALASKSKNAESGNIVVTGQPGKFYFENNPSQPKSAKKYEFVFFDYEYDVEPLDISAEVFQGFQQIYAETPEWQFWREQLSNKKFKGVPVFFHCEPDNDEVVISLGLSMMYKLPYKHNIHDAIKHTSEKHLTSEFYDFSDLIFGSIDENNATDKGSLKGRVNIGQAFLTDNLKPKLTYNSPTVLSSPKPTYYPMYIKQVKTQVFTQLMEDNVEISGWKRYPLKTTKILPPPQGAGKSVQVQLQTVGKDVKFLSKLRFHNLKPMELGALLWVLDFGGRENLRHSIGIGKPYGLGQITIRIMQSRLRTNDINFQNIELESCRQSFIDYMSERLGGDFESQPEIHTLMAYALPNAIKSLDYMPLADFANKRHSSNVNFFRNMFSSPQDTITIPNNKVSVINSFVDIDIVSSSSNEQNDQLLVTQNQAVDVINSSNILGNTLAKQIDDFLNTNKSGMTNELYLLDEIEKPKSKFSDHKAKIAEYIKEQYISHGKWREQSSSNKAERKLFEQTNRIKRLLISNIHDSKAKKVESKTPKTIYYDVKR